MSNIDLYHILINIQETIRNDENNLYHRKKAYELLLNSTEEELVELRKTYKRLYELQNENEDIRNKIKELIYADEPAYILK